MNIYTSETEYLKTEVQRLRALVRAQQITIDKLEAQSEQEPVAYINVEQRKLEWAKYMSWDTPTVVNLPKIPLYTTPPAQRTWVGLMRGVRVEGDTVVISVKDGNEAARKLCGQLINEMEMWHGND